MKRAPTAWIGLLLMVIPWAIGLAMDMPREIDQDDPMVFHILFWLVFLGAIRVTVFWFQTLIHGIKNVKEENRVAIVLGHVLLGPIVSYGYYLSSRLNAKHEAAQALQSSTEAPDGG